MAKLLIIIVGGLRNEANFVGVARLVGESDEIAMGQRVRFIHFQFLSVQISSSFHHVHLHGVVVAVCANLESDFRNMFVAGVHSLLAAHLHH